MADVTFEFGIGAGELLKNLKDIRAEFVEIKNETAQSKDAATKAFQAMAAGGDAASKELSEWVEKSRQQQKAIDELTKKLKALQSANKSAFDDSEIKDYENEIEKLNSEIADLQRQLKGVSNTPGPTKANEDFKALANTIDAAKAQLASLKPDSAAFKQLASEVKAGEVVLASLGQESEETGDKMESAKKQLKDMVVTLQNLKLEGLDNTKVYQDLKGAAGELKDTIADVNDEIKSVASDTSGIDKAMRGIDLATNAFAGFQGIMALTGSENEDLQKTLVKLNAIMLVTQSLQQVMNELKRADNVLTGVQIGLEKAYAFAVGLSTGALKGLKAAIASTGFGALAIIIGALVVGIYEWVTSMGDAKEASDELNRSIEEQNALLDADLKSLANRSDIAIAELEAVDAKGSEVSKTRLAFLKQEQALREDDLNKKSAFYNESLNMDKETFKKATDELVKSEEANKDIKKRIRIEELKLQKVTNDEAKKAGEEAKKRDQERLKAIEDRNKRILELERSLQQRRIEAIKEGRQKEIEAENQASKVTIEDLTTQKAKATGKELDLINKNIEQEKINHKARLLAIDLKYYTDASDALKKSQDAIDKATKDQDALQIDDITSKYDEIRQTIIDAEDKIKEASTGANKELTKEQMDQLTALKKQKVDLSKAEQDEILKVIQDSTLKKLDAEEHYFELQAMLFNDPTLSPEALQKERERRRLKVIIEEGEKRLKILKQQATEENKILIAETELAIQDAQEKLNQMEAEDKKIDIFKILGLDMSDEEKEAIMSGIKTIADSIASIWEESINKRIADQERLVEALNKQIDDQEKIVDREKELLEKGYANNFDIEQKKLEDLKANKEKEAEALQKAQEDQKKFAAAQTAINGIVAASQLAVSAANFFAGGSKYGPIAGTILSVAAIATMLSTFIAASKQAKAASQQQFEYGGGIDLTSKGSSHSRGGIPFFDASGKKLGEARQGEYGYFFKDGQKAKKYSGLFDLINSDKAISLKDLREQFAPIGISIPEQFADEALKNNVINVNVESDKEYSKAILAQNETLKTIASNTKKSIEYRNGYRIEREGNRVRKIIE